MDQPDGRGISALASHSMGAESSAVAIKRKKKVTVVMVGREYRGMSSYSCRNWQISFSTMEEENYT